MHTLGKLAPDELAPHTAAFEAKLRHIQRKRSKEKGDSGALEPEEVSELEAKLAKAKGAVDAKAGVAGLSNSVAAMSAQPSAEEVERIVACEAQLDIERGVDAGEAP